MIKNSDASWSPDRFQSPKLKSIRENYNETSKQKCIDELIDAAYVKSDFRFCDTYPLAIRSSVASIVRSSLNNIYDKETDVFSDEFKKQTFEVGLSPDEHSCDAYGLIDTLMEKMLTPSKKEDENIWNSNAKIRDSARIPPNINWPKNEEFTPELGGEKIKTYIKMDKAYIRRKSIPFGTQHTQPTGSHLGMVHYGRF